MKVSIGIDNGLKGCAVAVSDGEMKGVARFKNATPTRVFNMMDREPLRLLLHDLIGNWGVSPSDIDVLLEEPAINQGGRTNAHAIASTAASFGRVLLILESAGIPSDNIRTCAAVSWQKFWWKTSESAKEEAKPSIRIAQQLFKNDFIPKGCRDPDDGWADAALMAYTLSNPEMRVKFLDDEIKRGLAKEKAKAIKKAKTKEKRALKANELKKLLGGYD